MKLTAFLCCSLVAISIVYCNGLELRGKARSKTDVGRRSKDREIAVAGKRAAGIDSIQHLNYYSDEETEEFCANAKYHLDAAYPLCNSTSSEKCKHPPSSYGWVCRDIITGCNQLLESMVNYKCNKQNIEGGFSIFHDILQVVGPVVLRTVLDLTG